MLGTEKQVAWAESLKKTTIEALECIEPYAENDLAREQIKKWRSELESKTSAVWWIDNRWDLPKPSNDEKGLREILFRLEVLFTEVEPYDIKVKRVFDEYKKKHAQVGSRVMCGQCKHFLATGTSETLERPCGKCQKRGFGPSLNAYAEPDCHSVCWEIAEWCKL